jgi:uncharacterized protein (TIGR03437 family)
LTADQTDITINTTVGERAIPARIVLIGATGATDGLVVQGGSDWLLPRLIKSAVSPTEPTSLSLQVQQARLTPGSYATTVSVGKTGVDRVTVRIRLNVAALSVTPDTTYSNPSRPPEADAELQGGRLRFIESRQGSNAIRQYVEDQVVVRNVDGSSAEFTVSLQPPSAADYLSVEIVKGSSPPRLRISARTQNLPAGTYRATIVLTRVVSNPAAEAANPQVSSVFFDERQPTEATVPDAVRAASAEPPLMLEVLTEISTNPLIDLSVSPAALNLEQDHTSSIQAETIFVSASSAQSFTATLADPAPWISLATRGSVTPSQLTITLNASALSDGTYFNSVVVSFSGLNRTVVVPVTYRVRKKQAALVVGSTVVPLTAAAGGAGPTGSIRVGSSEATGIAFRVTSAPAWLKLSALTGQTPAVIGLTPDASTLTPGQYSGTVFLSSDVPLSRASFEVRLTVTPCIAAFGSTVVALGENVDAASIMIGAAAGCSWAIESGAPWVRVSPSSGTGTVNLTLSLDSNLTSEIRTATLKAGPTQLLVQQPPARPTINHVVTVAGPRPAIAHAATQLVGGIAPGQLFSLYGTALGPHEGAGYQVLTDRTGVTRTAGEVQVLFDGVPAPMLFASYGQINAIAPWSLAERPETVVRVTRSGIVSREVELKVTAVNPGVFTVSAGGKGQAAVLNEDFTVNSARHPARRGEVIQIFATGGGTTAPLSEDGKFAIPPFATLKAGVRVLIGGLPAPVIYAGSAPGQVNGIIQINAVLPAEVSVGESVPLQVEINREKSPDGVTIAIR